MNDYFAPATPPLNANNMHQPGVRVTIHLKNVPQEASRTNLGSPFTLFGLLKHEHKKSTLNFTIQRNTEYEGSVRSKVARQR